MGYLPVRLSGHRDRGASAALKTCRTFCLHNSVTLLKSAAAIVGCGKRQSQQLTQYHLLPLIEPSFQPYQQRLLPFRTCNYGSLFNRVLCNRVHL